MAEIMVRVEAHRTYRVEDSDTALFDVADWADQELPGTWHIDVDYRTGIN